MSEAMRRLREPSTSYDVLRDFGASYAAYPKRVSAVYFERLANALNQTATQLQEGDHQYVEKAPSRKESLNSSEKDKSYKSLLEEEKPAEPAEEEQVSHLELEQFRGYNPFK
ncbi:hypothetical protein TELCIR_14020 [Teladorsagia circumcincta]|uniref:Uncharacterized protein n=1 Tax=Teladorsagia circumcincta TaxID=45464 RepID=A0A2G9U2E4_TELCI|nr:hypothetical protein TELCIR_14020 [Teladorsagia circumcincta]